MFNLINYDFLTSTPVILTICISIIILFIFFVIVSFFIIRFLQKSFDYNNIFFYKYNQKCKKIINKYGDYQINKIYIVRQPFGKFVNFIFNVLTLFNYNKYLSESNENYPYHPALIFEIKQKNNVKFLLVEKNNCINICETFLLHKNHEFKRINNIQFIFSDKIIKKYYSPSDFTLHIINCLFIIINFIEKYVLDNNIFY